ncbi:isochorismatase family protein [Neorhizobium lilium]|uniref:Isochorismatase family protein n=1 Tax=Neorhizobium lilium TaxID=2503024 RepID=A0A444LAN8_9HYPH|nr:isochorismatase family protein [Neorhizobium lilium]RWX74672.1 isochorismatase family protein [Neorhizobium lilium]
MHSTAFNPGNSALLLIDHQVGTIGFTHSHDINLLISNTTKLAKIAAAVDLPSVLTSSQEDQFQGPLLPVLEEILPTQFAARIKRRGIVNAMHDDNFAAAVRATGRKKLFVSGIATEVCILYPVLQLLEEGYEVQVSADTSASHTLYGDTIALRRMEQAGAIITTVDQIIAELAIDWSSLNGKKLLGILNY